MTRDQLKARILEAIDRRAPEIIAIGERIRTSISPGGPPSSPCPRRKAAISSGA
jgi:hypothetical protein